MPNHSKSIAIRRFQCRHIFTDGHRCGSPCLRHQDFCYYHHTTRRPKLAAFHDPFLHPPNETSFTLPTPEDPSAIQHAIGEIMNGLARNALDPHRAGLLLYALQIASLNLQSTRRNHAHNQPNIQPETVEDFTLDPELGPLAPPAEVGGNQPISKKYLQYGLTAKAFGPNIVYGGTATLGTVTNSMTGPSFATDASSTAANTAAAACYALPHPPCLGLFPDYDYTRTNPYADGSTTPRQHIINKHILCTPTATPPNTVYVNPGGYSPDEMFKLVRAYNFVTVLYNPIPVNGAYKHTYKKTIEMTPTGPVEKGWIGIDASGNDLYTNTLFLSADRCRVNTSYPTAQ